MSEGNTEAETVNSQEPGEETPPARNLENEVEELRSLNRDLSVQIQTLVQALSPQTKPAPEVTPDQFGELLKTNPKAAIEMAVKNVMTPALGSVRAEISTESQKKHYDDMAESEFPLLKKDREFQKMVQENVMTLTNRGGMHKDSPMLVYTAAQMAALKYKPKPGAAAPNGNGAMSGEAPRSGAGAKAPAVDKNFDALCSMFGVKDKEGMRAKLANQKGKQS